MLISTGSTSYTTVASGVIRFAWHTPHCRGDGLLVDMDAASQWCDVADVLLWPTPVDPVTAAGRAARSQVAFAIITAQPAHWIILTFSHEMDPALAVRAVTHRMEMRAADQASVLEVVVKQYHAIVARHEPHC